MNAGNAANPPELPERREGTNVFQMWKEYEAIAIHFNDLILKLRIQALGGVAAIAAIAGIVLKEAEDGKFQWNLLGFSFLALIPVWVAVWLLDFLYYTPLLYGAVEAIRKLETLRICPISHFRLYRSSRFKLHWSSGIGHRYERAAACESSTGSSPA
jgi:hypothetical protein